MATIGFVRQLITSTVNVAKAGVTGLVGKFYRWCFPAARTGDRRRRL